MGSRVIFMETGYVNAIMCKFEIIAKRKQDLVSSFLESLQQTEVLIVVLTCSCLQLCKLTCNFM